MVYKKYCRNCQKVTDWISTKLFELSSCSVCNCKRDLQKANEVSPSTFLFYNKKSGSELVINSLASCPPEIVISLYISWYNSEFICEYPGKEEEFNNYEFVMHFITFDFYDESLKKLKELKDDSKNK